MEFLSSNDNIVEVSFIYEENCKFYVNIISIDEKYLHMIDTIQYDYAMGSIKEGFVEDKHAVITNYLGLYLDKKENVMNKFALRQNKIYKILNHL